MTITPGYVYLIQAGETDLYKIGLTTRQPEERLRELNGKQSPYPLTLAHYIYVEDANETESYLHEECREYHHHNEWFKIPADLIPELIKLMNKCVYVEDVAYTSYSPSASGIELLGAIVAGIVLLFGLAQCSKMSNPKYADCIRNQGGNACERLIK